MIALIRKDLAWLFGFLVFGVTTIAVVLPMNRFFSLWLYPVKYFLYEYFVALCICGASLGLVAAIKEELSRTEEFLLHRPVSPPQMFIAKTAACLCVMLAWIIIPFALSGLPALWRPEGSSAQWGWFWEYAGVGACAFSAFAICYHAVSLRLPYIVRFIICIVSFIGWYTCLYLVGLYQGENLSTSLPIYTALHLVCAAFLIYLAYLNFIQLYDQDQQIEGKKLLPCAAAVVLAVMMTSGVMFFHLQDNVHRILQYSYPNMVEIAPGKILYAKWDKGKLHEKTEKHDRLGVIEPKSIEGFHVSSAAPWPDHGVDWINNRYNKSVHIKSALCCYDSSWEKITTSSNANGTICSINYNEGNVYLIKSVYGYSQETPFEIKTLVNGEKNAHFSKEAICLGDNIGFQNFVMILEPSDGSIWYLDLIEGKDCFKKIRLPDNDSVQGVEYVRDLNHPVIIRAVDAPSGPRKELRIRGKKGVYLWKDDGFIKAALELEQWGKYRKKSFTVNRQLDPINPYVEAVDLSGNVILSHQYGPFTGLEKIAAGLIYVCSAFRAPAFQVMSFLSGKDSGGISYFDDAIAIDPLLYSGKRAWLLLVNLAITALLIFLVAKRLLGFHASRTRTIMWSAAVLLGGLSAYIVFRLFETKRRYAVSPVSTEDEAPEMLIFTKRTA